MHSRSRLLSRLATHPPDAVAVVDADGTRTTYRALAHRSAAAGAALRARGVGPGRTVVFLVEPGVRYVETLLAIWQAGAIAVPLSPLHAAPELAHVVEDAAPLVRVASAALAPRLHSLPSPPGGQDLLRAEDLVSFPAGSDPLAPPDATADALMLYTSGTTGRPKGVRLTHAALAATVTSLEEAWRWRRDDRLLHALPLHHTHGVDRRAAGRAVGRGGDALHGVRGRGRLVGAGGRDRVHGGADDLREADAGPRRRGRRNARALGGRGARVAPVHQRVGVAARRPCWRRSGTRPGRPSSNVTG